MAHDSGGDMIAALADWIVAVQAADLTPTARRVGATLIRWARLDLSGHVWPSAPTVGKVLGIDPDRVREAFRDLRRAVFLYSVARRVLHDLGAASVVRRALLCEDAPQ